MFARANGRGGNFGQRGVNRRHNHGVHLRIGDGDVDFEALFGLLGASGFLGRSDALIVSNVFAEDESADEVSRFQLQRLRELAGL